MELTQAWAPWNRQVARNSWRCAGARICVGLALELTDARGVTGTHHIGSSTSLDSLTLVPRCAYSGELCVFAILGC
ncbi:hypothetical protein TIFTF001_030282 [Ficus carica]|uniref:Uncharacterized protein n=1 Tax=Ficus carica TaxID=3494 RepID=A0AA88DTI8_FICCA|nr:hypothetical protein TIFTF001_030282 [Ficus carica]